MGEATRVLYAVVIVIAAAAAIFTGIDVFLALKTAKAAPEYFDSGYRPEHGTEFCRAHLAGRVCRLDNRALYLIETHPRGCDQSARADCPGNGATRSVFIGERKIL